MSEVTELQLGDRVQWMVPGYVIGTVKAIAERVHVELDDGRQLYVKVHDAHAVLRRLRKDAP